MMRKQRESRGKRHSKALSGKQPWRRLSDEQVTQIRRRRAAGESLAALAREMGVSETTVSECARGKTFSHVGPKPVQYRRTDVCRARGCAGLLMGTEAIVSDGDTVYCGTCGRGHTYHVAYDGGPIRVEVHRKSRATTGKVRGRGGAGGWVLP